MKWSDLQLSLEAVLAEGFGPDLQFGTVVVIISTPAAALSEMWGTNRFWEIKLNLWQVWTRDGFYTSNIESVQSEVNWHMWDDSFGVTL